MKEREKQYEQIAEIEKGQRLKYMNDNYKTSIEYKKEKEREQKESELEEERERLKRIERDLKEEQRRNNVKKATFVQEAQEVANHKRMMKELEEHRKQQERSEYQKLASQNYQKEVEREDNYKKFFKEYDNHLGERMSNHMKYVTSAQVEKQHMLDEIEDKNQKEHQDWLAQKEQNEKEERLKNLKEMHSENRKVFDKLDKERTHKKEMYQMLVEQRKKEEDDYKSYLKKQAEDDNMKRKLYRDALEFQKGYHDYNKNHLGQMTKMEKKLNKHDLRSYKEKKTDYEGMIPGIHNLNSVGSRPLLRKANDDLYDTSKNAPPFVTNELNKSLKDLKTSIKPLEDFSKTNSPKKNEFRYDPITNPIPFVNQNPYINKEKEMFVGEGASSLINSNRRSRRSLLSSTAEKNILI